MTHTQTPSQTVGPYFAYGLTAQQYGYDYSSIAGWNLLEHEDIEGEHIIITGKLIDGDGELIPDALIEIWQADANGNYATSFHGFGRVGTGTNPGNQFIFQTIKPGRVGGQAPHINMIVFMRGLLIHAYTRLYFSDEAEANSRDEVLNTISEERRQTLIAQRREAKGVVYYDFVIRMQGENETVFFDV